MREPQLFHTRLGQEVGGGALGPGFSRLRQRPAMGLVWMEPCAHPQSPDLRACWRILNELARTLHAHSIAGFLSAWVVAYVAIAAFCLLAPHRKGERSDFFVFGWLSIALSVHTAAAALLHVTRDDTIARCALGASGIGRSVAAIATVHVVVQLAQLKVSKKILAIAYSAGALLGVASALDMLRHPGTTTTAPVEVLGLRVYEVVIPPRFVSAIISLVCLGAALFAVVVFTRSVLRGRKDALLLLWGALVLLVATMFDTYAGITHHGAPLASPYGNAAFVMGATMLLLARYARLRRSLEERAIELKQRSAELGRAYEELRAAQEEMVRKEQLAAVGELSAVIAHEVRNPLAIITTAVATLRRDGLNDEDRQTLLGILDDESARLNRIVTDLLRYTKPVRCERQLVSPKELVDRALSLAQTTTSVKTSLVDLSQGERISADPQLLRQVFDNLVSNAVQAMPQGGRLTATIASATEGDVAGIEVRIADTGEGMDTSVRSRAFDPFFTTRAAGTGLGLAIVARIIDAHGGTLSLTSDVGVGTEVRVFLPQSGEPSVGRKRTPSLSEATRSSSLPPMPPELKRAFGGKRAS